MGLVYVGYAGPEGEEARKCRFSGSREEIRRAAVDAALALLSEHI